MRGRRRPSEKRRAEVAAHRKWERRAAASLALRHGQCEFDRSVKLAVRKAVERRNRRRAT